MVDGLHVNEVDESAIEGSADTGNKNAELEECNARNSNEGVTNRTITTASSKVTDACDEGVTKVNNYGSVVDVRPKVTNVGPVTAKTSLSASSINRASSEKDTCSPVKEDRFESSYSPASIEVARCLERVSAEQERAGSDSVKDWKLVKKRSLVSESSKEDSFLAKKARKLTGEL